MSLSVQQIQDALYKTILNHSVDAIVFIDSRAIIKVWSQAAERLFGIPSEDAVGQKYFQLVSPPAQIESEQKAFQASIDRGSEVAVQNCDSYSSTSEATVRLVNDMIIRVDRTMQPFLLGDEVWMYIELRDAEPRKRRESELERVATTDLLSQLVNRRGFQQILEDYLLRSNQKPLTLAIVDIDKFKEVNDQFGHEAGDQAIQFVAGHLQSCFPNSICVARLGGDEFGVVLETAPVAEIERRFETLRQHISDNVNSVRSEKWQHLVTVSIGVAVSKVAGSTARDLLSTADRAMYQSKKLGRNQVVVAMV